MSAEACFSCLHLPVPTSPVPSFCSSGRKDNQSQSPHHTHSQKLNQFRSSGYIRWESVDYKQVIFQEPMTFLVCPSSNLAFLLNNSINFSEVLLFISVLLTFFFLQSYCRDSYKSVPFPSLRWCPSCCSFEPVNS